MSDNPTNNNNELIEKLADIEHQRWADWQEWCHKVLRENNPSPEIGDVLERWDRQIETPYRELSELEKQSDRDQVKRYWPLIERYAQKMVAEELKAVRSDMYRRTEFALKAHPPGRIVDTEAVKMAVLNDRITTIEKEMGE